MTWDHLQWEPRILKHQPGYDDPFNKVKRGSFSGSDNTYRTHGKKTICTNIENGEVTEYVSLTALVLDFGYIGATKIMYDCIKNGTPFKGKYLIKIASERTKYAPDL